MLSDSATRWSQSNISDQWFNVQGRSAGFPAADLVLSCRVADFQVGHISAIEAVRSTSFRPAEVSTEVRRIRH